MFEFCAVVLVNIPGRTYEKNSNLIAQTKELSDNIYIYRIRSLSLDKNKIFPRIASKSSKSHNIANKRLIRPLENT